MQRSHDIAFLHQVLITSLRRRKSFFKEDLGKTISQLICNSSSLAECESDVVGGQFSGCDFGEEVGCVVVFCN
jgi:hypothetical protein